MIMKKSTIAILIVLLLVSLAACSDTKSEEKPVAEKPSDSEISTTDQYDINDYVGMYSNGNGRLVIGVQADSDNNMKVDVQWADENRVWNVWNMTGKFDNTTGTLKYSDSIKKQRQYDDSGEAATEKTIYENGTGLFKFTIEGDSSQITWLDDIEVNNGEVSLIRNEPPSGAISLGENCYFPTGKYIFLELAGPRHFELNLSDDLSFEGSYSEEGQLCVSFKGNFSKPEKLENYRYSTLMESFEIIQENKPLSECEMISNFVDGYEMEFIVPGYQTSGLPENTFKRLEWYYPSGVPKVTELNCIRDIETGHLFFLDTETSLILDKDSNPRRSPSI